MRIIWVMVFCFLMPGISLAGTISMHSDAFALYKDNEFHINLTVKNLGNEAARNVQIEFKVPGRYQSEKRFLGDISPKQRKKTNFNFGFDYDDGSYPGLLFIEYEDINGHPFSVISSILLVKNIKPVPEVDIFVRSLSFFEKGKLSIEVVSRADKAIDLNLKLHTPKELESDLAETVHLEPHEVKNLETEMVNKRALLGSSYVVLITGEYDKKNHVSLISSNKLFINKSTSLPWLPFLTLIILFVLLILRLKL